MKKFSKTFIDKLGLFINDFKYKPKTIEGYAKCFDGYYGWRASFNYPLTVFRNTLIQRVKGIDARAITAQRLKRTFSIRRKLSSSTNSSMRLSQMQDVGGLRAVLPDVRSLDLLKEKYLISSKKFKHKLIKVSDYITNPKDYGYRGFHLVYEFYSKNKPEYNGYLIEIQLRTHLQHTWATTIEILDVIGKTRLKWSFGDDEVMDFFKYLSSASALREKCPVHLDHKSLSNDEIISGVENHPVKDQVIGLLVSIKFAQAFRNQDKNARYYLLILDLDSKSINIKSYTASIEEYNKAIEEYNSYEKRIEKGENLNVVLVKSESLRKIKEMYPNYLIDTQASIKLINSFRVDR